MRISAKHRGRAEARGYSPEWLIGIVSAVRKTVHIYLKRHRPPYCRPYEPFALGGVKIRVTAIMKNVGVREIAEITRFQSLNASVNVVRVFFALGGPCKGIYVVFVGAAFCKVLSEDEIFDSCAPIAFHIGLVRQREVFKLQTYLQVDSVFKFFPESGYLAHVERKLIREHSAVRVFVPEAVRRVIGEAEVRVARFYCAKHKFARCARGMIA